MDLRQRRRWLMAKNAVGFGLGLSGLLLAAAASWISFSAISTLLLAAQLGISGLIAGWLGYELTPRLANGNGVFRVAVMTFFATACAVALSIGCSLMVWPFSMRTLALYFLLLPVPCLVIVPLWAAIYLQLVRLQNNLELNAAVLRRDDMVRLLAGLCQAGRSAPGDPDPPERLAVSRHRR
jgi:hypothetical protein